jgi:uncharacterized membrane protein HdeD (DUF308 family)
MNALIALSILALLFFVAHVLLLFTSFGKDSYRKTRYFWSHLTLWICGIIVFVLAFLYAGKQVSPMLDVFDTPGKQALILLVVVALSFTAHMVVKMLVMPKYKKQNV